MPGPQKFLLMIPVGFFVAMGLYLTAIMVQLGVPTAMSHWCGEINRKKLHIAQSIPSPKLVILGGSASFFGVKASILEQQLGVRTVNVASHAALGMAYLLEQGKQSLRPGDTVVLLPEYELFDYGERNRRHWANEMYVDYLLAQDPRYYRSLPLRDQLEIALMAAPRRVVKGLVGRVRPERPPRFADFNAYDPSRVDRYGDMTGHRKALRPMAVVPESLRCSVMRDGLTNGVDGMALIANFCQWAEARQIRVLASFPNLAAQADYQSAAVAQIDGRLREFYGSLHVPVVGDVQGALLPAGEFFDTAYHPSEEAAIARSERLALQLRTWFGAGSLSSH